jgi:hypothetical protein
LILLKSGDNLPDFSHSVNWQFLPAQKSGSKSQLPVYNRHPLPDSDDASLCEGISVWKKYQKIN